jgi:hypothetical protein
MKYLNQITLQQALEYNETDEKFTFICDTFGCFAHQEGKIATIEAYLIHLLSFNQNDYLNHLQF